MNTRKFLVSAALAVTAASALAEPLPGEPGYPEPAFVSTRTRAEVQAEIGMPDTTSVMVFNGINLVANPRLAKLPPAQTREAVRADTREWLNTHRTASVSPAYLPY